MKNTRFEIPILEESLLKKYEMRNRIRYETEIIRSRNYFIRTITIKGTTEAQKIQGIGAMVIFDCIQMRDAKMNWELVENMESVF